MPEEPKEAEHEASSPQPGQEQSAGERIEETGPPGAEARPDSVVDAEEIGVAEYKPSLPAPVPPPPLPPPLPPSRQSGTHKPAVIPSPPSASDAPSAPGPLPEPARAKDEVDQVEDHVLPDASPDAQLRHAGASQIPPPPLETANAVATAVARLRAEVAVASTDRPRRARLLYEAGEVQELGGDEAGAARDYLAAFNSDTTFREPLEGLVRLLERRRSFANIGKLIEALVDAAATPEERARALTQRAIFAEDVQKDLEGARGASREATETGAGDADLGPAWLGLEMAAAKLGDRAQREDALAGRAELTDDPTWRGLLLVDAAELAAASGEVERALGLLGRAQSEGGGATYAAALATERVLTAAEPSLSGEGDAKTRHRALAEALEARAEMIHEATIKPELGDEQGVPRHVRNVVDVVDLLLRSADSRRASGELVGAAQALDRALAVLEGASGDPSTASLERVVLTARLRVAEISGDTALAASLAEKRLAGETDGGIAASLAMRIAEHAASEGNATRALDALARATERDPLSAPPRALAIDILGGGKPDRLAAELEELAKHVTTEEARGRTLLLAAWIWGTGGEDAARARATLAQAGAAGVPAETIARIARSLASIQTDRAWYEDATQALVAELAKGGASAPELPLLWIELARIRIGRGDDAGAAKATAALGELPEGAWLGRVLDGLAAPDLDPARARNALEELTEQTEDAPLRRSLAIICAMRARAAGDERSAIAHLERLAKDDPADPLVSAYLSDVFRLAGNRGAAAALAAASADAHAGEADVDAELGAARHLEAGFEQWALGDRSAALTHFDAAAELAPAAASPAAAWAARGIDVDSPSGRRRALDAAGADAATQLERFALESVLGDADDAAHALAGVDVAADAALRVAAAIGRLTWAPGNVAAEALDGALGTLATADESATIAAAAERLRLARESGDAEAIDLAARTWLEVSRAPAAAVEWLASAVSSGDVAAEILPRRALADLLTDEAREALQASATLLEWTLAPDPTRPLLAGSSQAVRLANLELAPPGCDPRRRAATLSALDGALGEEGDAQAAALAAWATFAAGDARGALAAFGAIAEGAGKADLHVWEGMRAAAEELGDHQAYARACEQLGERALDDARGAAFWEQAALAWSQLGRATVGDLPADERAERALDASFARDATRKAAFDRLFRRVRDKKEHDRLLALIERRLGVTDDAPEIAKLYWEQARALREKGDPDAALEALEHVTMFDENHVGALALTGEIFIRKGQFEEAAEKLSRLARVEAAPPKNRVTAGVAAVDLYENKLQRNDLALGVLLALHRAKLSTLPVRERLARAAARTGSWTEATAILEELMNERPERDGRIEAARLAMAIHRDRLGAPVAALPAATKILDESATDGEALDLVLGLDPGVLERGVLLERGRDALLMALNDTPTSIDQARRLARVAATLDDDALAHSALACVVALGGPDGTTESELARYTSGRPRVPATPVTDVMLRQILSPGDEGPLADLFAALGPTLGEALGPTRDSVGVGRRDRVDAKSGTGLRAEIAAWAGAFGVHEFDLYVGGKEPDGIQAIAGDDPALVVGPDVKAPLTPLTRARLARELVGLVRGTTVTRWRDDATIAAIVVAACNLAKVRVDAPPLAVLAEVERVIGKAISRRTKAAIEPLCRAAAAADARAWAARARATQARCAAVAAGDVSIVLPDALGITADRTSVVARDDLRAHELFRFVLSRPYFELRRGLGLEEDA